MSAFRFCKRVPWTLSRCLVYFCLSSPSPSCWVSEDEPQLISPLSETGVAQVVDTSSHTQVGAAVPLLLLGILLGALDGFDDALCTREG